MARQKTYQGNDKPSTKTEAIRRAVTALGGLDHAETSRVAEYVQNKWGIDAKNADVSQWKSNERARLRKQAEEGGQEAAPAVSTQAAPSPPSPSPAPPSPSPAPVPSSSATNASASMTLADIHALAGLVNRYGKETIRKVITSFYGE